MTLVQTAVRFPPPTRFFSCRRLQPSLVPSTLDFGNGEEIFLAGDLGGWLLRGPSCGEARAPQSPSGSPGMEITSQQMFCPQKYWAKSVLWKYYGANLMLAVAKVAGFSPFLGRVCGMCAVLFWHHIGPMAS